MTSMTDTAGFPAFSLELPDDVRAASERALNLWVGATSPLWMPFWAASGFGVGMWSLLRGFRPSDSLMAEMPLEGWPNLFRSWGLEAGELHEKAVEAVENAAQISEPVLEKAVEVAVADTALLVDPVTEAPEAIAEPPEAPVELAEAADPPVEPKVEPRPIARGVSAARKPRTKA